MADSTRPPGPNAKSDDTLWTVALVVLAAAVLVNLVNWALVKFDVKPGPADDPVPVPFLMAIVVLIVVRRNRRTPKDDQS